MMIKIIFVAFQLNFVFSLLAALQTQELYCWKVNSSDELENLVNMPTPRLKGEYKCFKSIIKSEKFLIAFINIEH